MRTEIEKQKTKRINVYFICQEREKKAEKTNDRWLQSDHHKPTRAFPVWKRVWLRIQRDDKRQDLIIEWCHKRCMNGVYATPFADA